jgi:hypothetical protein
LNCGIKKEALGRHFGVVYYFNELKYRFYHAPPCFKNDLDAEKKSIEWEINKFKKNKTD